MQCILLSLVFIQQQDHSIFLKYGQVARKKSNNQVTFTTCENDKLFKCNGTSTLSRNFSYLIEEGNLSPSILWHVRFRNINYDSICIMKKNSVLGLPIFPKTIEKYEACILM